MAAEELLAQIREANEQLILATLRAEERAEEASVARANVEAARDEFLSVLGHELRNPLSPILLWIKMMEKRQPDILVTERDGIKRQVTQLLQMMDTLLVVTRMNAETIILDCERTELEPIVQAAAALTAADIERKNHRLVLRVPEVGCMLDADLSRMTQVFKNLLTNAAKFTPDGGTIIVAARPTTDKVLISVKDDGIGIDPAALPHVFDVFSQTRNGTRKSQGGLGIGLTVASNLVKLHGGRVVAHSSGRNTGATFVVELPLAT